MVAEILKVLREAYPDKGGQLGARFIEAVARVLANQVRRSLMIRVLKETSSSEIHFEAEKLRSKDEVLKVNDAWYRALWNRTTRMHAKESGERMLREVAA